MQTTKDFQALLSAISHEVRNPVTLINSYLQLLSKNRPDLCDDPYWNSIISEMSHLKNLLSDITSYQNGSRLSFVLADMNMWLANYVQTLHPLLSQTPYVTFTYDVPPDLPQARIDGDKLRQILDNLVRNSLEAIRAAQQAEASCPHNPAPAANISHLENSGEGAQIAHKNFVQTAQSLSQKSTAQTEEHPSDGSGVSFSLALRARAQDGFLCICVQDNGCGIKKEELETLFQPFVTHKPEGTGLGLAIAQQIATAHGGSIKCSSCFRPTEFQILLPAQSRPESRPDGQSDPLRSPETPVSATARPS